jgi:hypothetical protein
MKSKKAALKGSSPKAPKSVRSPGGSLTNQNILKALAYGNNNTQTACSISHPYFEITQRGGVPLCLIPAMCGVSRTRVKQLIVKGRIQTVSYMGMRFAIWTSLPSWWQYYPGKITSGVTV